MTSQSHLGCYSKITTITIEFHRDELIKCSEQNNKEIVRFEADDKRNICVEPIPSINGLLTYE